MIDMPVVNDKLVPEPRHLTAEKTGTESWLGTGVAPPKQNPTAGPLAGQGIAARGWTTRKAGITMSHSKVLGIDVSKDKLDCSLVDADGERRIWFLAVTNDRAGVARLPAKADPSVPLVAEPTGPYTVLLAKQATAANRTVLMAPPRKAKDFKRSLQSRAKTDDIDSFGLALFGASRRLPAHPIKSDAVEELDSLLSYRKMLSGNTSRAKAQARSLPRVSARIKAGSSPSTTWRSIAGSAQSICALSASVGCWLTRTARARRLCSSIT